jgi:hypothetical protein
MANRPLRVAQYLIDFLGAIFQILAHQIHVKLSCELEHILINIDSPHSLEESTLLHVGLLLEVLNMAYELGWVRQIYMSLYSS